MANPEIGWILLTIGSVGLAGTIWYTIEHLRSLNKRIEREGKLIHEMNQMFTLRMKAWREALDD
jgi:hypothetical protein